MVVVAAVRIGADVRTDQPQLAIFDSGVAILQIDASVAQRFDLRAQKHNPGFHRVDDFVIVPRLAVEGDDFFGHVFCSQSNCRWVPAHSVFA